MNQRNVQALKSILADPDCPTAYPDGSMDVPKMIRYLASHRVLVLSVLTNEQVLDLGCHDREECRCNADEIRADLEQIAKGEP